MTPAVTNAYLKVFTIVKNTMIEKCDYASLAPAEAKEKEKTEDAHKKKTTSKTKKQPDHAVKKKKEEAKKPEEEAKKPEEAAKPEEEGPKGPTPEEQLLIAAAAGDDKTC